MARECFLMAGGGTGGHVMPLLAVAERLRARGHRPYFIGTPTGFEARLVPQRGFPLEFIDISGFQGTGGRGKAKALYRLPWSVSKCIRSIRTHRPKACFSLGGYVAAPPVLASVLTGVPVVAMEPNAIPGMVNRLLGRFAAKALLSFEEAASYFPPRTVELTGLPVREAFFEIEPRPRAASLNVLITGGSQGSQTLNRAVRETCPLIRASGLPIRLRHQCGKREVEAMQTAFASAGVDGTVEAFIEDMPAAFAEADLIVSRAGAGAVGELAAAGRPSVLVPFPFAADGHQTKNAEALVKAGAATMVRDADLSGGRLFEILAGLAQDRARLETMARCSLSLRRPGAAERAAAILEEIART